MGKLSIDEARNIFKDKGFTLLDDKYISTRTKMKVMDREGYLYNYSIDKIRENNDKTTFRINKNNPYSIYNIKNYIKLNNINIELLSEKYINNSTNMLWKCKCGNTFEMTLASFKNKHKYMCNKCSKLSTSNKQKLSYEEVKIFIEKFNENKLISEEYINNSSLLKIKCKCGNIFYQTYARYRDGKKRMCDECFNLYILNNKKQKSISSHFNEKDICPCNVCSKECIGVSKCNIYRYYIFNNINELKDKWSEKDYYTIIDFILNNKCSILDDLLLLLDNKTMEDLFDIFKTLNIRNLECKVRKYCSNCGKEVLRKPHMYNWKYCYCSKECKNKQSIIMMNDGVIKNTRTEPHNKICELLKSNKIMFEEEYKLKYQNIDIYCNELDVFIEIMGDYWHGNPNKYKYEELTEVQRKDVMHDKRKHTYVKKYLNKEILYLWEFDINNNIELCNKLINKYIYENGNLLDYNSYNYYLKDGNIVIKENIIKPYFI